MENQFQKMTHWLSLSLSSHPSPSNTNYLISAHLAISLIPAAAVKLISVISNSLVTSINTARRVPHSGHGSQFHLTYYLYKLSSKKKKKILLPLFHTRRVLAIFPALLRSTRLCIFVVCVESFLLRHKSHYGKGIRSSHFRLSLETSRSEHRVKKK